VPARKALLAPILVQDQLTHVVVCDLERDRRLYDPIEELGLRTRSPTANPIDSSLSIDGWQSWSSFDRRATAASATRACCATAVPSCTTGQRQESNKDIISRVGHPMIRQLPLMDEPHVPWIPRALQVLDLRSDDRLLLAMPGSVTTATAAANVCGPDGSLTVLEPRRSIARAIATALPAADVLVAEPVGTERFGSFDAVLAVPLCGPLPPVEAWAGMVATNLRPGGRFAVDLPGPTSLPDLAAAAQATEPGFAERLSLALSGPSVDDLTSALATTGLRRVQSLLGTHLVRFSSPFELIDLLATWFRIEAEERTALGDALARQLRGTADIETLAHRSGVAGMR